MKKFTIRKYHTNEILHEGEAESFKEFVEKNKQNLTNADLEGANLKDAYLEGANLNGANLEGANLKDAYLNGAYLKGADLEGAYLGSAYLGGADLNGANFKNSTISINNKRIFAIKLSSGGSLIIL